MADNLDIRARLTAEDSASATIQGLMNRVKQLERQIKSSFAPNKITGNIVSPKVMKDLQGAGKEINGLTKKYKDMARETRDLGNMNGQEWLRVTNDIRRGVKAWKTASGETRNAMGRDLKERIKYAQAYRSLYNAEHRDHLKAVERHQNTESALQVAHMRRLERLDRQHMNARMQARRDMMRGVDRLSNVNGRGVNPIWYGVGAAYGAGHLASSSIRSATDLDRAEANARINMEQSVLSARDLRNWAMPRSIELGQQPARFMQTAVEAAKAGVPEAMAQGTAEMVTMLAKTFGVEVDQAMDGMGYAIAQEMGAGRLKDMKGVNNLGNITAYLAAKTAARPDQMFSFLRTGMGSGAMLGMSQEATLAFGAAGIQAGAQGQQTARFLGSIGETLAGLTMKARTIQQHHGSRSPKDRQFLGLPAQLGYGGYADIEDRIRKSPDTAIFDLIKSFGKIKDPLKREQAMTSMFGADFARFLANMISSPEMLDRTLKLAKEAAGQKEGANFVSEAWGEFTKSLEFFVDRVKATWSVVKAELGDVLKPFIQQFSDWVTDWYRVVKTGGIKERFKAFLDGLTQGFLGGPGSFRDLLERAFGKPGEGGGGSVESFFKFARGFAAGLKEFVSGFVRIMQSLARYLGGGDDAEATGKFTAKLLGLVAALTALGPVLTFFSTLVGIIGSIVAIFGGPVTLGIAAGLAAEAATPDAKRRRKGEKYDDWQNRLGEHKRNRYKKSSGEGFDPSNIHPMSNLSNSIDRFNGTIQRVAFMGGAGGFNNGVYYGGGSAGGGGGGGRAGRLFSGAGTPSALINSTPGGTLPNFGMGSNGIIKRDNIPSFSGGGGSVSGLDKSAFERTFAGTPLAGKYDQVVAAAKANGIEPSLLASVMAHETGKGRVLAGNNPGGIMDPATGMAEKMQLADLDAGISKTASTVAKNWIAGGRTLEGMGRKYAPVGAANDPTGLNGGWAAGVRRFQGDMAEKGGSAPVGAGVEPGLASKLGIKGGANFMKGQYGGPGENLTTITAASGKKFAVNAASAESFKGFIDDLEGSGYKVNSVDGYNKRMIRGGNSWSQHAYGNAIDINPGKNPMGYGPLKTDMPSDISDRAAKYGLSWGGDWKNRKDAMHFEWMGKKPWLDKVPAPTDAVKNVPPAAVPNGDARLGGGNRGDVAIHINGGSHDPESLATLVQRRVDESMNWRAHDSESEYT